jgi:hypothetical protein
LIKQSQPLDHIQSQQAKLKWLLLPLVEVLQVHKEVDQPQEEVAVAVELVE